MHFDLSARCRLKKRRTHRRWTLSTVYEIPRLLNGLKAMFPRLVVILLLFLATLNFSYQRKPKKPPQTLSRGWGDDITWVQTYEEGLTKMKESKKPLMVIHHKEDCPYSQALKTTFSLDKNIQKMAQEDFIMLNLMHETSDKNLAPDGWYVPRILFVDPSMTIRADIAGQYSNHLYTYQPDDMDILVKNMRRAKILLHTEL